jgi:hypothetical protein
MLDPRQAAVPRGEQGQQSHQHHTTHDGEEANAHRGAQRGVVENPILGRQSFFSQILTKKGDGAEPRLGLSQGSGVWRTVVDTLLRVVCVSRRNATY